VQQRHRQTVDERLKPWAERNVEKAKKPSFSCSQSQFPESVGGLWVDFPRDHNKPTSFDIVITTFDSVVLGRAGI